MVSEVEKPRREMSRSVFQHFQHFPTFTSCLSIKEDDLELRILFCLRIDSEKVRFEGRDLGIIMG